MHPLDVCFRLYTSLPWLVDGQSFLLAQPGVTENERELRLNQQDSKRGGETAKKQAHWLSWPSRSWWTSAHGDDLGCGLSQTQVEGSASAPQGARVSATWGWRRYLGLEK